jgi:hypothetical protein
VQVDDVGVLVRGVFPVSFDLDLALVSLDLERAGSLDLDRIGSLDLERSLGF